MRILIAPDKFKGTATAGEVAAAIAAVVDGEGHDARETVVFVAALPPRANIWRIDMTPTVKRQGQP